MTYDQDMGRLAGIWKRHGAIEILREVLSLERAEKRKNGSSYSQQARVRTSVLLSGLESLLLGLANAENRVPAFLVYAGKLVTEDLLTDSRNSISVRITRSRIVARQIRAGIGLTGRVLPVMLYWGNKA